MARAFRPAGKLPHLAQQPRVLHAVNLQLRITVMLQQPLFRREVHASKFEQPRQNLVHRLPPLAPRQRQTQLVHRVHQNAVLIVQSANANRTCMVPG